MVTAGKYTVDTNCGPSIVIRIGASKNFRHNLLTRNAPNISVDIINIIQIHLLEEKFILGIDLEAIYLSSTIITSI